MSPENRALDMVVVQKDRARGSKGYLFQTVAEMSALPKARDWLIKGILARGESSGWIAPPGRLKSALMAEAAICVAAGIEWHGHRNKGSCGVVYFALERADLVRRRILAHVEKLGLKDVPIVVVGDAVDPRNSSKIIATIREAEQELGISVGFVIFDTFAKLISAGNGLDEQQAGHQGIVFDCLQRVKNATRVHVAIVGHTGKEEERGWRGSNASLGDVDVMVMLSGEGEIRTATVKKANDIAEGELFSFTSEVHSFGVDEDGDPITVNVVSADQVERPAATKSSDQKLTGQNQRLLFRILHDAGTAGLTRADWNSKAREAGVTRDATLNDVRNALLDKKMIRNHGDRWSVCHD